jgi:hypothetical protein
MPFGKPLNRHKSKLAHPVVVPQATALIAYMVSRVYIDT